MIDVSSDVLLEAIKKGSDDPLMQVACLIYHTDTKMVLYHGTNVIVPDIKRKAFQWSKQMVAIDKHPSKKFIMQHAEITAIQGMRGYNPQKLSALVSLQPCMACVQQLVGRVNNIYWMEDNRHQPEQEIIKPAIPSLFSEYHKIDSPMLLNVHEDSELLK